MLYCFYLTYGERGWRVSSTCCITWRLRNKRPSSHFRSGQTNKQTSIFVTQFTFNSCSWLSHETQPEPFPESWILNPVQNPEPWFLNPVLNPEPWILNPFLNPEPWILNPVLNPEPWIPNPVQNPKPWILNPEPWTLN